MDEFAEFFKELAAIKQAMQRTFTEGTVHEVDAAKQMARLRIGGTDDKPVLGPWVPYGQWAGALKGHVPVSVGQQMTMIAPMGNWRRATLVPMTFSEQNESPSQKGDENVWTYGGVKVELRAGELVLTLPKLVLNCGGKRLEIDAGVWRSNFADYDFDA